MDEHYSGEDRYEHVDLVTRAAALAGHRERAGREAVGHGVALQAGEEHTEGSVYIHTEILTLRSPTARQLIGSPNNLSL